MEWSDGSPITTDDFLALVEANAEPEARVGIRSYLIYNFVAGAKDYYEGKITDFSKVGFSAPDAHTIRVTLANPTPFLINILADHYAWHVLPIHVILKFGALDEKSTQWTRPGQTSSASGPFMLKGVGSELAPRRRAQPPLPGTRPM